jgi:sec-independent protein translocase protein TatA
MPSLGPWELAIILVIVVIIFGVGKLPEIGGALGKGIKEFRTSASADDDVAEPAEKSDVKSTSTTTPIKEEL